MDSTLARLEKLGLSSYESKAVLALLKKHPSNGYQVGKIAGIPISKVYDVLGKLKNKGVVTADESVTPAQYYPIPVDALVARLKSSYDAVVHELENVDLPRVRGHRVKQYLGGVGKDNGRHEEEIHQGVQA